MAFITISVPDAKFDYYKQILSEFKELSLEDNTNEIDNIFTPSVLAMLAERRNTPREESISLDELRQRIKAKYAR
jgi:hypothetical protein